MRSIPVVASRQVLVVISMVLIWTVSGVSAHGIGYLVLENDKAITIACHYSDGTPVRYAETLVFSPRDINIEYQNGRTDRKGRFSFFPEEAGLWRIETTDGLGHKAQRTFEVGLGAEKSQTSELSFRSEQSQDKSAFSKLVYACLGISLIFNICAGVYIKNRKSKS
ncbi:MAG: hypothetical protein MI892_00735 [Desulfobacterales bacterium]|nr:hypothetical protein [Desulfobacterales bacterium]